MKETTRANLSTHAWRGRLFRAASVLLLQLAAIHGLTPETGWLEFGYLLTPAVVFPMLGAVLAAATTSGKPK